MKLFAGVACTFNTLIFATYYAVSKETLGHIEPVVFTFLTLVVLLPLGVQILLICWRSVTKETVRWGVLLASFLCLTLFTTVVALRYTTATSTSFFPALSGFLAALIAHFVLKQKLSRMTWFAGAISVLGTVVLLLSASSDGAVRGDGIAFLGAFFFTCFIFFVDRQATQNPDVSPWPLLGIELITLGIESSVVMLLFGNWTQVRFAFPGDLYVVAYIALAGTLLPMLVFLFLQKYLSPITVSFLSVLEPVLGGLASYILLGETIAPLGYAGGVLLLVGTALHVSEPVVTTSMKRKEYHASPQRRIFPVRRAVVALLLISVFLVASGVGSWVLFAQHSAASLGSAVFVKSAEGLNDELQIEFPSLPAAPPTMAYTGWLVSQESDAAWLALGSLTQSSTGAVQTRFLKQGSQDDLLQEYSELCITLSNGTQLQPLRSDCKYYGEITHVPNNNDLPERYSLLDHARHLLASDPTLEKLHIHYGLMTNFDAQVSKIAEWASATKTETSMPMVHKHMVRILDVLDGFSLVHNDVPAGTPLLVATTSTSVGVLRGSTQAPSYVGHIEKHVNGVLNSPYVSAEQVTLARQMYRAMQIITSELHQVYVDAKQLVLMNNAQLLVSTSLLEDLRSNASNAYSGGYQTALSQTRVDGTKDLAVEVQKFSIIQLYAA